MQSTFFQAIGGIVESIIDTIQNATLDDKFIQLQSVVSILITLSIMYKGYLVLASKSQDPVRELVWDIARKLLILTFVLNVNGWLKSAISALDGIYAWAGGGAQFYQRLDEVTNSFLDALVKAWSKEYDGLINIVPAIFICTFMIISFIAVMAIFSFTIISATLTNTFLIIALPLALFCLMYEITKQVFVQWINMFLSNIFLLIFMTCFIDFMTNNLDALYNSTQETNFFIQILQPIFIGGILIVCISVIKALASGLAQASLDSAGGTAMNSVVGGVGKMSGMGAKTAGKFGLGMISSKGKAWNKGGLAGIAGYGTKAATRGLGKAGYSLAKKFLSKARGG